MVSMHCYLLEGVILENIFRSLGVASTGGATVAARHYLFRQGFLFSVFLFFHFWLCVSLMSTLALDILLLQSLGVFSIILILIYSFIKKMHTISSWFFLKNTTIL
jgi:uncharacterized membrane protein